MKKIIRLTESDLTRIVKRVISEQMEESINLPSLGFTKWDNKGHILRLPQGSTNQNDSIRITVKPMGEDNFLVGVVVNGNKKIRSEMTKGLKTFDNIESILKSPFKSIDNTFESTSGQINGDQTMKIVNMLKSLKIDQKNNMFSLNESRIIKRVISEQTSVKEGRNNPLWINLVSKLKTLPFQPRILTFNIHDQSLNWGTAKSSNGEYAFSIGSADSKLPKERMSLFNSDDRKNQMEMHNWWKKRGYVTDGTDISISYKDANKLRNDIESFFGLYPPQ